MTISGSRIHITGIIQGVGFRPFVYGLAQRLGLRGWVRNTSAGVVIEVDGEQDVLNAFALALREEAPPLASISSLEVQDIPSQQFEGFEIQHSEAIAGAFQPISPDVSICPDCQRELFDPGDRRYRYPFINCTNCGPRFTIIQDIPYDRPKTTMSGFPLCPDCQAEYTDPSDRRFHAQPVACPVCGPHIWLEVPGVEGRDNPRGEAALSETIRLLAAGKIVAIKGLGGFHLACSASDPQAVQELRQRKLRVDKPFAVMLPDLDTVRQHCWVSPAEAELLQSGARPVVILRRRPGSTIDPEVTPRQDTLGVMLPYTPLHYLLFAPQPGLTPLTNLVMTSGNLSEEPIATDNEEARQRLASLADAFLMHNRPIHIRCDDSVVRSVPLGVGEEAPALYPLRRARGYTPFPVILPWEAPPVLAAGAELKNTFCITHGSYAFLSHHIGDLENYETLRSFEDGVEHFERLFRVEPQAIAYDLHPDYLATRYALERGKREGLPLIGVQHHHAHIAACMAEHSLDGTEPVLGVSFDGVGYGLDGAIWGGEFLLADYSAFRRLAHLQYVPLPGGDRATQGPWRMALAWLASSGLEWSPDLAPVQAALASPFGSAALRAVERQIETGMNTPLTSSMGRLFDAAAALAGVRQSVNYEGQAAIEFEALADSTERKAYPFEYGESTYPSEPGQVSMRPLFAALLDDLRSSVSLPVVSARFHNGIARMVIEVCQRLRQDTGVNAVALSGGVWQNLTLLSKTWSGLEETGFITYVHRQVPANDGGLALGQAVIAAAALNGQRQQPVHAENTLYAHSPRPHANS